MRSLALRPLIAAIVLTVILCADGAGAAPRKKKGKVAKKAAVAGAMPAVGETPIPTTQLSASEQKGFHVLSLIKGGKLVQKLNLTKITDKIQPNTIIVYDPFADDESAYRAFRFNLLLTIYFGHGWQDWDELLLKADDGYETTVPIERFVKHTSYLAFERPDNQPFELIDKINDRGKVSLGPYYLTWENLQDLDMRDEGAIGWSAKIRSVELVKFDERYPKMAPPKDAPKPVRLGFIAYRKHCMACHTMNGEGGIKGDSSQSNLLELNYPVSVTEFIKEEWLEKWVDHPQKIRHNTLMPRLDVKLRDRDLVIKDILAYLQTMAANKREPATK